MIRTARAMLLALLALLLVFGITMLYSTSYTVHGTGMLRRQLVWIVIGTVAALVARAVDYREIGKRAPLLLILVALALGYLACASVLHRLPFVPKSLLEHLPLISGPVKGSFRWFRYGGVSIQPSEFAKPVLILFLANVYSRRARYVHEFWRGFLEPMLWCGGVVLLILLGGNLSITVITGTVVGALAFVAGVRLRYLLLTALLGVGLVCLVLSVSPERRSRLTSFRDPEKVQVSEGYQLWASQLALGSGGATGLGFTNSRMKQQYLPETHTDFIIAIVGEELGFVAVVAVVFAYVLLTANVFWIGALASDREGTLLCTGIALSFAVHAFVNISVVTGFAPTTGVTAPFISYGGSSMIAALLSVGLVLNVCRIAERDLMEKESRVPVRAERAAFARSGRTAAEG